MATHSALSKSSASCTLIPTMPSVPDLPPWAFLALFAAGLVAGTVDAIAGGGGLISLPVLLGLGLPAPVALGTSKLQGTFGSGSAAP